ncbi:MULTISPECIES: hypothetical protein [unclassified Streptomyces]|uniref:hypothetical protein n=1 Tax=unclassified Streptomyces TaxID=2593676 RepID=UPI0006B05C10|nr:MULTISPECIES: hypothetical protein [unclassified Streptomyces]KOX30825.1 hypothetical protein ADL06_11660 [Streptomyces sp. NRRL F-6491]KOX38859.1 hypothetical protein ADL08_26640 [Streptomyces sp. NRRL F-6492]
MTSTTERLRREWTGFRRVGRLVAMAVAALAVVALGLLRAAGDHASCDGPCPAEPTGPDGTLVNDRFSFLHRDMGPEGSITVRLTSMTGTITYPPPHHDRIVPGLVPWAKVGIIVKDGVRPGSSYAALMSTGGHGVRMQYDYRHDIAGGGGVVDGAPRWLRLTRSGDTVTGHESADGTRWTKVGAVRLPGLPGTVQVGLFAASPGDLTLRRTGLGGATEEVRWTQAGGTFDRIALRGAAAGGWRDDAVGERNRTDWEKNERASGAVEENGTITVTGAGDIGPRGAEDGARPVEHALGGLFPALLVVLVISVRYATAGHRTGPADGAPVTRSRLAAKAVVLAAVTFATGLLALGIVVPAGATILKGNGIPVLGVSVLTGTRVVVGTAGALALAAVLALALGSLLRRSWLAILVAVLTIAVPYAVASVPLLPDGAAQWLLRVTPAAGFAVRQTLVEHPQVVAHYAPSAGYFPLPWWAGVTVLCAYTAVLLCLALRRLSRSGEGAGRPVDRE